MHLLNRYSGTHQILEFVPILYKYDNSDKKLDYFCKWQKKQGSQAYMYFLRLHYISFLSLLYFITEHICGVRVLMILCLTEQHMALSSHIFSEFKVAKMYPKGHKFVCWQQIFTMGLNCHTHLTQFWSTNKLTTGRQPYRKVTWMIWQSL